MRTTSREPLMGLARRLRRGGRGVISCGLSLTAPPDAEGEGIAGRIREICVAGRGCGNRRGDVRRRARGSDEKGRTAEAEGERPFAGECTERARPRILSEGVIS